MIFGKNFQFCFDISFDEKCAFFVPCAYIINNSDKIIYVDKKATAVIIESFGLKIENLDAKIQNLLAIIEVLKPENLFKKFEKNPKTKKTIFDLLNDKTIEKIIKNYFDLKLNQFLTVVKENDLPLSFNLKSSKEFNKYRISTNNSDLETNLLFDKNVATHGMK